MKQKVRVVGIVELDGGILLMKKKMGRYDGDAAWELPTGKIGFGEQPEEAISRVFFDELGVKTDSIKLVDVVTFLGLEGATQLNNLFIVYKIVIQEDSKITTAEKYSAYKIYKSDSNTSVLLSDATLSVLEVENSKNVNIDNTKLRRVMNGATVFIDGSSRGNPGPSGIGYYIVGENGKVIKAGGEFIGFATSRVAEYFALKEGCEQAIELGLKNVRFVGDNLMMINQMNGVFRVKNSDLIPIRNDILKLLKNFDSYAFVHVKRVQNTDADREANRAIDRHFE